MGASRVRLKPEARREQILAAATAAFCNHGFDNTSTRELSRAARTSTAGIYHHFPDKEHLLFAILDGAMDDLLTFQQQALANASGPRARVEAMVRALVAAVTKNRQQVRLLFKEDHRLSPEHLAVIRAKQRRSVDLIREELAALHRAGGLREVGLASATFALVGMVNWLYFWWDPAGAQKAEALAADFCTIFLDGVLAGAPGPGSRRGEPLACPAPADSGRPDGGPPPRQQAGPG